MGGFAKVRRVLLLVAAAALANAAPPLHAKESGKEAPAETGKEKGKKAAPAGKSLPPGVSLNACGCYRSGSSCVCTDKKAKCECPGDCEPVGCEEKRQKEIEREIAAETKRAQDEDKKRKAAEEAAEAAGNEGSDKGTDKGAEGGGDKSTGEGGEGSTKPAKPTKPARKEPREKK